MRYIALCLIAVLTTGCRKGASSADATSKTTRQKPMVMTESLTEKSIHDSLLYPARIDAGAQAGVLAETDGLVKTIKTSLGRAVQKGDILMTIENPDPVYKYEPIAVTAPVSGVVAFLDASIGNRVERGHKLAVIADVRAVKVKIEATASDLSSLKFGDVGTLFIGDKTIATKISAISPVVDPSTGTATVELTPPREERLLPGMMGRVEFHVRERRGIQVPDSAVVFKGTDPYLRIVDGGGKAVWRKVKQGASAGGLTDIIEGAAPGERLIVRATTFIADGDEVEVQADKQGEVARQ